MSSYDDAPDTESPPSEGASPKKESKPKASSGKMSDKQKADLTKHMEKMKKQGMTGSEMKSHRMKLMSRMRKDPKMTANKAHKDVMKK